MITLKTDTAIPNRVLYITGEINERSYSLFIETINKFIEDSCLPITIYINSTGGYCSQGLAIADKIRMVQTSGIPVLVVATGIVASMGAVIFLSSKKKYRYITKNTTVMIHQVSKLTDGTTNTHTIELEVLQHLSGTFMKIYKKCLGMSEKKNTKEVGFW